MKSPWKTNITLATVCCQVFKVDTFDNFEREHLIIGQLIFCHNNWSFFLSPNICSAALFVQGEEERTQNIAIERFAKNIRCTVECLMKSNFKKIETTPASKGGRSKLSNYPHRLSSLPAQGGVRYAGAAVMGALQNIHCSFFIEHCSPIFICTESYFKLPIIAYYCTLLTHNVQCTYIVDTFAASIFVFC